MRYDNGSGGWYDSWNKHSEVNFAGKGGMADGKGKRKCFKGYCYNCGGYGRTAQYCKNKSKGGNGSGMNGKGKGEFMAGNGLGEGGKGDNGKGKGKDFQGHCCNWKIWPFSQGMPNWWSKCSVVARRREATRS